jgi:hypothetical protein
VFFDEDMRMRRIAEIKCSITNEKLCEGLPEQFKIYMDHVKNLKFTERPDYDYMKKLFVSVSKIRGVDIAEHRFEWQSKAEPLTADPNPEQASNINNKLVDIDIEALEKFQKRSVTIDDQNKKYSSNLELKAFNDNKQLAGTVNM